MGRGRRVLPLLLGLILAQGAGCASFHGRQELDEQLFLHHNNLRWGRLGNAALQVKPDVRAAFMATWSARSTLLELQDVEVMAVDIRPGGETAEVVVAFIWVERASMSVKQSILSEEWRRTAGGWVLERPAELPFEG